ncbi:unnamed protein product, partial [Adineta steineri]
MMPGREKSYDTIGVKQDVKEVTFKAIFSTSYIVDNENEPSIIENLDVITNKLNKKLNPNAIRFVNGFFRNNVESKKIRCDNPLNGNILQLDIVPLYADECIAQDDNTCKNQLKEQLKTIFDQMMIIPIKIQLENNQFENIDMKICNILNIDGKKEKTKASVSIAPKGMRLLASNRHIPYTPIQKARCSLSLNKIALVQVDGDYGTNIYDDIRTYTSGQSHQPSTVTLDEETTHNLHVQLKCGEDSPDDPCSDSLSVHMWVDYNDNQVDDGESHILHRSWPNNGVSTGTYDLQIYVPAIDDRIITTTPYVNVSPICSIPLARIILVIMAGEVGSEIRDDKVYDASTNTNQNQHHMTVTLYENTIYLLRIQLDCSTQMRTELTETGCNLAQDVDVWVDWNDDGNFDASEIEAPYLLPVTSYLPQGV